MEMGIVPGKSCVINWDSKGVGGASAGGYMTYFGIRNNNAWQTWVTDTTNSWASASDARLKTVLGPLEDCTAKLAAIRPVYFEYKADASRRRRIGLIAQECQVHFPETVAEGPGDPAKSGPGWGRHPTAEQLASASATLAQALPQLDSFSAWCASLGAIQVASYPSPRRLRAARPLVGQRGDDHRFSEPGVERAG